MAKNLEITPGLLSLDTIKQLGWTFCAQEGIKPPTHGVKGIPAILFAISKHDSNFYKYGAFFMSVVTPSPNNPYMRVIRYKMIWVGLLYDALQTFDSTFAKLLQSEDARTTMRTSISYRAS